MNYTLITGASSGIGFELASVFARNNHNLILVARSTEKLESLKTEIEKNFQVVAEVISMDLSKAGAAEELFKAVNKKNLKVDILVNNAGLGDHGLFIDEKPERIEEMVMLNVLALTQLTKLFLPAMLDSKYGKILNVASIAAFQAGPLMSVYYATKAYVLSFSEGIFEELKGTGVSVTALCPGPTQTDFLATANVSNVPALDKMGYATSKEVAEYGFDSLMQNKAVAVQGLLNSIVAGSSGFIPRSLSRKVVMRLQKKRTQE